MTNEVNVNAECEVEIDFDPYYMELEKPIKFGKDYIESFKLKEPTCKDMRTINAHGNMTFGDLLDIGQRLTEQPRRVIDSLSKKDAVALVDRVGFLLGDGT